MIFRPVPLSGACLVLPERMSDERGYFARSWCAEEFRAQGLSPRLVQCSISFNPRKGTLRGMHLQLPPHAESKLVRCTRGSAYDVAVDLRPDSPTYLEHFGAVLSSADGNAFYIPEGCAHGYLTLEDDTEIFYQMSEFYTPGAGQGVRYDDPAFGIRWPGKVLLINDRDRNYPDYRRPGP
jgi:dTDP-4-dehydrorhamnose 3,5-epimerase